MNATLGNAVELIVSIIALVKCEIHKSALFVRRRAGLTRGPRFYRSSSRRSSDPSCPTFYSSSACASRRLSFIYLAHTDLLVMHRCFFAGGIKFQEQGFKDTAAQLNSSLLVISVIGASPLIESCRPRMTD